MALKGSDYVALLAFWSDLTYDEIHSFTIGFSPVLLALVLNILAFLQDGAHFAFYTQLSLVFWGFAATITGAAIGKYAVSNEALDYIVREVHYCLGGQSIAGLIGLAFLALV